MATLFPPAGTLGLGCVRTAAIGGLRARGLMKERHRGERNRKKNGGRQRVPDGWSLSVHDLKISCAFGTLLFNRVTRISQDPVCSIVGGFLTFPRRIVTRCTGHTGCPVIHTTPSEIPGT